MFLVDVILLSTCQVLQCSNFSWTFSSHPKKMADLELEWECLTLDPPLQAEIWLVVYSSPDVIGVTYKCWSEDTIVHRSYTLVYISMYFLSSLVQTSLTQSLIRVSWHPPITKPNSTKSFLSKNVNIPVFKVRILKKS